MTQATEKPAKKLRWFRQHKILTALIILIVIGMIGSAASGSQNNTPTSSNTSSKQTTGTQPASRMPGLNQEADDGKIGFTVTSFKCGVNQIEQPGDQYGTFTTSAKAPYCVLSLSMKGIGTQAQNFDDDAQFLYTANGTQYSADDDATFDANDPNDNCTLSASINPGVTVSCSVVFDVPAGTTITYATLHDSAASGGVRVNL